jgi:hypothetical protein
MSLPQFGPACKFRLGKKDVRADSNGEDVPRESCNMSSYSGDHQYSVAERGSKFTYGEHTTTNYRYKSKVHF